VQVQLGLGQAADEAFNRGHFFSLVPNGARWIGGLLYPTSAAKNAADMGHPDKELYANFCSYATATRKPRIDSER
jgi:hypothetical protein